MRKKSFRKNPEKVEISECSDILIKRAHFEK